MQPIVCPCSLQDRPPGIIGELGFSSAGLLGYVQSLLGFGLWGVLLLGGVLGGSVGVVLGPGVMCKLKGSVFISLLFHAGYYLAIVGTLTSVHQPRPLHTMGMWSRGLCMYQETRSGTRTSLCSQQMLHVACSYSHRQKATKHMSCSNVRQPRARHAQSECTISTTLGYLPALVFIHHDRWSYIKHKQGHSPCATATQRQQHPTGRRAMTGLR